MYETPFVPSISAQWQTVTVVGTRVWVIYIFSTIINEPDPLFFSIFLEKKLCSCDKFLFYDNLLFICLYKINNFLPYIGLVYYLVTGESEERCVYM